MRLSTLQKSQILTGALGSYTVEALSKAALHTYPSMREARGQNKDDRGRPSHPASQRPQQKFHPRRPFGGRGKRPWRANEAHIEDIEEEDDVQEDQDEWEEEWPEDYDGDEEEPEEEEEENEVPQELDDALMEADAWFTRAKKQRAEVEKARGFFKKGVSSEDRDKGTNPLKEKLPCSKCGQLGHWHKDPICPMHGKPFPPGGKGGGKRKSKGSAKRRRRRRRKSTLPTSITVV